MSESRPCVMCDMAKAALCEEEAFVTGVLMGIVSCENGGLDGAQEMLLSTLCSTHREAKDVSFGALCLSANIAMRKVRA